VALALLWELRDECPGAVPVLVCHDEIVVECDAEQVEDVSTWLESALAGGMDVILNGRAEVHVPVEVEPRISESWRGG
jgi:DNA polymerase I-like protein with 3'-5' exonuclease and polymerase domains